MQPVKQIYSTFSISTQCDASKKFTSFNGNIPILEANRSIFRANNWSNDFHRMWDPRVFHKTFHLLFRQFGSREWLIKIGLLTSQEPSRNAVCHDREYPQRGRSIF